MVDTTRSTVDIAEGDLSVPTGLSPDTTSDNKDTQSEHSEMETRGRTQEYEEYDEEDARAMSPRRSIAELEQIGSEAKALLEEYVRGLHIQSPIHSLAANLGSCHAPHLGYLAIRVTGGMRGAV